uniref:Elongator complex protein 1 n=1 Tax=Acrobeloides nanus TaxID=290746 RepID=A0A914C5A1_9BILA
MKNLHLYFATSTYGLEVETLLKETKCFCIDSLNALTYFALPKCIIALDTAMKMVYEISWVDAWDPAIERLILFDFLFDEIQLCAVFDSGKVLYIDPMNNQITEIASLPSPLLGGAWSPDLQALVLASSEMLFLVSREFEIISEENINPTSQGKDQLLTVGWGSRESQFQGAGTLKKREAADLDRMPSPLLHNDDRRVIVSWRADAQFFTVSSIMQTNESSEEATMESRRLRVWNRELELMSHCDWLSGIENVLTMRPQGNLIATTRISGSDRWVWLYERNGQYRSKFCLGPAKDSIVRNILWNSDSSVLSILFDTTETSQLHFWTVSNYEWAQKLVIQAPAKIIHGMWDLENNHCFHFITETGHYRCIYMERMYDVNNLLAINVNGNKLRVTDLPMAPIPPPMSHFELELPTSIIALCQSPEFLAVLFSDQSLSIYEVVDRKYKHKKSIQLPDLHNYNTLYNLQWIDDERISALCKADNYKIVEISLKNGDIKIVFSSTKPLIWHKFVGNDLGYIIQLTDGDFLSLLVGQEEAKPLEISGSIIQLKSVNCHKCWFLNEQKLLIALTRNHQLLINGNVVHSSIGSVSVSEDFVIVTTLTNILHCLPVKELKSLQAKDFDRFEGRVVERGSTIVTNESNGTRVWLQMPRGNLETIHPRALLIDQLQAHLNQLEFSTVLKEMRRHRVDMNLLYDNNPQLLLENVKTFVDQINDADLLNLFILSLCDEDTTTKIFAPFYMNHSLDKSWNEDKVNRICSSLVEYILSLNWDRLKNLYTSVLSCLVKMKPSKISEALSDIKVRYSSANSEGDILLREWLRHLSYLVDDRLLFNKALKTYDLHVALLVAEACDRDPKEYLPLLRDLQKISPPSYQQYHIDLKVDPPDLTSALSHLAEVEERFDETIQFIKKHRLYSKALAVFQNKPRYKDICRLCAENLLTAKRYEEAVLLFRKCEDWESVLKCHELGRNYKGYIEIATANTHTSKEDIAKTLERMALSFETTNDFATVAEIYRHLNIDKYYPRIIENFCKALHWTEALNVATAKNDIDQLRTAVDAHFNALLSLISNRKSEIEKHIKRLEIVRENKMKQIQQWIESEGDLDIAQSETMSEASTTVSNLSRISKLSTVSSRRRKNIDRKKKLLKEGSPYEDAAILAALKEIYLAIMKQQDELRTFLPTMVSLDMIDDARILQKEVISLFEFASQSMKSAWPKHIQLRSLIGPIYEIYRGDDGIVRMPSEEVMPSKIPLDDELIPPSFSCDSYWQMEILK